jgi:hypothetical protein
MLSPVLTRGGAKTPANDGWNDWIWGVLEVGKNMDGMLIPPEIDRKEVTQENGLSVCKAKAD